jgi:hypothetical protein
MAETLLKSLCRAPHFFAAASRARDFDSVPSKIQGHPSCCLQAPGSVPTTPNKVEKGRAAVVGRDPNHRHEPVEALRDLFAHQEWADSMHWCEFASFPAVVGDAAVRRRLDHLHAVQRAFSSAWNGFPRWPGSSSSMEALHEEARGYYRELGGFLEAMPPEKLDELLTLPWFPAGHCPVSVAETMYQVVLHKPASPGTERDAAAGARRPDADDRRHCMGPGGSVRGDRAARLGSNSLPAF